MQRRDATERCASYRHGKRQTYHNDSCDVVGPDVPQDGESAARRPVSSMTIYNEMLKRRPRSAALSDSRHCTPDRRGECRRPEDVARHPRSSMARGASVGAPLLAPIRLTSSRPALPRVAPLTPQQDRGLDMLDRPSEDPGDQHANGVSPRRTRRGCHNHTMLHGPNVVRGWPEPERKRHLLRAVAGRFRRASVADIYAKRVGKVDIGDPAGIIVPGARSTRPRGGMSGPSQFSRLQRG